MAVIKQRNLNRLTNTASKPSLWLLVTLLALITVTHYGTSIDQPTFLHNLLLKIDMDRHAFDRIAYLVPIIWAGFIFGIRGAFATSIVALACMLPRAIFISSYPRDALFETSAVFVAGNLVAVTFGSLRKEKERRIYLDALNRNSSIVSQSLELGQILNKSIKNIIDIMQVDVIMIFLLDKGMGKLTLAAHCGVSENFVNGIGTIKVGEGFNGKVAETGEPLYVEDAANDPVMTKAVVVEEGIRSQLVVPLKSKGRIMGTLCAAMHSQRYFGRDETELLTAIGNQIGVAIENAHLYQQEREFAEQLRISEEKYRELFETANDAIWIHDIQGNIIEANEVCVELTGYALGELKNKKESDLIAEDCIHVVREVEEALQGDRVIDRLSEVTLVNKDGNKVFIQLSTSPVYSKDQLVAFQHIARDVTQEKRMQDNLHFYLGQITMAQEEERKRIARELHDDTIQALVVLSRQLDDIGSGSRGLSEEAALILQNLRQQTNNLMDGVRRLSRDLRPATLDRLGLVPALEWLASDIGKYSGIDIAVRISGIERRLSSEAELLLFRIAQEALRNVWRHSQATGAEVSIEFDEGRIGIVINDNGKGFDLPGEISDLAIVGKLGLAGMQERARLLNGSLKIESQCDKGTTVTIEVPL